MAEAWKILGQVQSTPANADATLYQVPGAKKASVRVLVANQGAVGTGDTTFQIRLRQSSAVDDPKQIVVPGEPLAGKDSYESTLYMLAAGENIRVQAGTVNVSFSATGIEADV
jgi:hypothetical protein